MIDTQATNKLYGEGGDPMWVMCIIDDHFVNSIEIPKFCMKSYICMRIAMYIDERKVKCIFLWSVSYVVLVVLQVWRARCLV